MFIKFGHNAFIAPYSLNNPRRIVCQGRALLGFIAVSRKIPALSLQTDYFKLLINFKAIIHNKLTR